MCRGGWTAKGRIFGVWNVDELERFNKRIRQRIPTSYSVFVYTCGIEAGISIFETELSEIQK